VLLRDELGRQIDVSELDDFLFYSPDIVIKLLNNGPVGRVKLLSGNNVGADFDCSEGIVEFVTNGHDKFFYRFIALLAEDLVLLYHCNLFFQLYPVQDIQQRSGKN
jgi:hypothetical protein